AGRADHPRGDRAHAGVGSDRGRAPAGCHPVRVAARLRHGDVRGARERLRARRDHVDPGRRARLHRPAGQDHARADPRRGATLPVADQLRPDRLPAQAMNRRGASALTITLAVFSLVATSTRAGAADSAIGAVTRTRLANGMTVLVRENPTAPVVGMSLMLRMGTRWETRETAGLSNFLQLMVVRGTTTRDGTEIVNAADRMGGSIDAYAEADYAEIAATALSRFWSDMLDLVADVTLRPSLDDGTIKAVRDFLVRQIRNRADKPYDAAFDAMLARTFGDNPYGWDALGLKESVERTDRAALLAHYKRHYVPGGMVLAISGKVKREHVIARAEQLFGALPAATAPPPNTTPTPGPAAARVVLTVPGAQSQILMGGLAPSLTDPDLAAMKLVTTVLGGGLASRFFSELRD